MTVTVDKKKCLSCGGCVGVCPALALELLRAAGGVLAASGAGATLVCDPMVDPRGGAYTVGLGVVGDLAVFPYHGTAADHLLARSIDLKPRDAILVGIDAETALVREPGPMWSVAGAGRVTIYGDDGSTPYAAGAAGLDLP